MKYETFEELFNELSTSEKVDIYNRYCDETNKVDDIIYTFDEEFFETCFKSPIDAARAVFFGNIQNWSDDYLRFDGYANLESLCEGEVENEINYYLEDIFECTESWEDYIEDDGEEDEDEEDEEDENDNEDED